MIVASQDWTLVLAAAVSAVPASISAYFAVRTRRDIQLPSGGKLGPAMERVQGLAQTAAVHTAAIVNGAAEPPHGADYASGGNEHGTEAGSENH